MTTLRPAASDDVKAIAVCARKAYQIYVERIGREPAPMTADFASQVADGLIFVLADEGNLFGFVVFYDQEDSVFLENIAVDPAHHGKGYGRMLIDFVEQYARKNGFWSIKLYTNIHMSENLSLYPSLGYRETGRARQDGFDRVFFEKPLSAR
ncbi:GNAT family N-acetyltransferase [Hoeflea poritis]|uniref:GNAT family N-acetyltransferase n=1 Tax=Hoeflea poritis TaxID=2993659 RepID=A0ABT4VQ07_9HYPH|nr:GNAT family N-acetyltransferase [Hoeflea poritis]MDA4846792.1 GNAT family N-acetyltransferase [Hoeflea poritis]